MQADSIQRFRDHFGMGSTTKSRNPRKVRDWETTGIGQGWNHRARGPTCGWITSGSSGNAPRPQAQGTGALIRRRPEVKRDGSVELGRERNRNRRPHGLRDKRESGFSAFGGSPPFPAWGAQPSSFPPALSTSSLLIRLIFPCWI